MVNLTIAEARRRNYDVFEDSEPKKRTAQKNALKYIDQLAGITNTSVQDWKVGVFAEGDSLVTNKSRINRIFFQYRESHQPNHSLPDGWVAALDRASKNLSATYLQKLQSGLRTQTVRCDELFKSANQALSTIAETKSNILRLENKNTPFTSDVERVLARGFWSPIEADGELIIFKTNAPVVLTHKNTAQAVDIKVDLGFYRAEVNLKLFSLKLYSDKDSLHERARLAHKEYPHRGSLARLGFYQHPHITGSSICWGTMSTQIREAFSNLDLEAVLTTSEMLLKNYNHGDAFLNIESFKEIENELNKIKEEEEQTKAKQDPDPGPAASYAFTIAALEELADF